MTAPTIKWLSGMLALALAVTGLTLTVAIDSAAAADAPAFDCTEPRFFAQSGNASSTLLYEGSYNAAGESRWTPVGDGVAVGGNNVYNGIAFNPVDSYLYATTGGSSSTPGTFVRIQRDGTVVNLGLSAPSLAGKALSNNLWDSGAFDKLGNYYIGSGNAGATGIANYIYKVSGLADVSNAADATRPAVVEIPLDTTPRYADFDFLPGHPEYLWTRHYGADDLFYRINVTNGEVDSFASDAIPEVSYGSVFTMTNGNLAFIATNETMYQVSITDPAGAAPSFQLVSEVAAPLSPYSDATNCATAEQADLSVTKTGPATVVMGEEIEWTITVTNDGPGISSGFVAIDTLPAGLTAVATSDDSSCVPDGDLIICNGGRLAVNESAVITVMATAPMTVGAIVNTVRVVGNEDSTPGASVPAETEVTLGTNAGGGDTAELDLGAAESGAAVTDGTNGTVVNTGGNLVYTPNPDFSGVDSFTYTPEGGSAVTVYVTVVPKAQPDAVTTAINSDVDGQVDENDSGVNLQFSKASDPTNGSVVMNSDGTFSYTPDSSFLGTDTFTYLVTGDGGSATGTVTVTVVAAPVAVTDAVTTQANTAAEDIEVLANDSGLALAAELLAAPVVGTVVDNGDNTFSYTPPADFSGAATFTYTLSGDGGTATGTVNVTVTPAAADDVVTASADTAVSGTVVGNDAATNPSTAVASGPIHGDLTLAADGSFTYTPDTGYSGTDQFTYTLTADGGASTATVNVTVTPSAPDDSAATSVGLAVVIDVLANDTGTGLTIDSHSAAGHGTVAVTSGRLSYTPANGYSGTDTFTYVARDAAGSTTTSTVTVQVSPVATADSISTPAASAITFSPAGNDEGSDLAVTATSVPGHGDVTINADGTVTYVPDAGYSGFDSFDYTATDSSGLASTSTVSVTVTPAPVPDTRATVTGGTIRLHLLGNDVGTGLFVSSITQPTSGMLVLNQDGTVTYTARSGFTGADTFTYTVTDAAGSSVLSAVTINVELPTLARLPVTGAPVNDLLQLATLLVLIGTVALAVRPRRVRRHRA